MKKIFLFLVLLFCIISFFISCTKNSSNSNPGNSSDTDPRDGSTWILNEVVYYYEASNSLQLFLY